MEPSGDPLNVLLLSTQFGPPLGADTWVHMQIMRTLDRDTHRVHVACVPEFLGEPSEIGRLVHDDPDIDLVEMHPGPQRPTSSGIKALALAASSVLPALWSGMRLAWYVRRRNIDVIHTTDRPRDAIISVVVAKLTRAKSIVHVHVLYADWMSRGLQWAIKHADARIAVSEFVKDSLVDGGLPVESTHAVLNAIDVSTLVPGTGRAAIRAEFGLTDDQPVVVTVCRLFAEKGLEPLVRAIDRVRLEIPDVKLLIVGEDTEPAQSFLAYLNGIIDELDVREHLCFTGRRPDVPALMAAADVFAMPSFEEPFGLVFGEAMAMERPVVALDNGGTREVVEHDRQGLLSAPGDLDALTDNLVRLLKDPDERRRLGEDGRRRVLDEFRIERMGDDIGAVYRLVAF